MTTTQRIYVADLGAYNAGILRGEWIDLNFETVEAVNEKIDNMLANSPESNVIRQKYDCSACGQSGRVDIRDTPITKCPHCGETTDCKIGKSYPSAEEFAIHDHEGFPGSSVGEYSSITEVMDLVDFLENCDHGAEVAAAALSYFSDLNDARSAVENYAGHHTNAEDFAYGYVEDTGMFKDVPQELEQFFDYAAFGRSMIMDMVEVQANGGIHLFHNF